MGSESSASSFDEINPTPGAFDTPGTYTPGFPVAFRISHQDVSVELFLTQPDAISLEEHKKTHLATLAGTEALKSAAALAFSFLEHLSACRVSLGILARVFYAVQSGLMQGEDIHSFTDQLPDDLTIRQSVLRTYVALLSRLSCPIPSGSSELLAARRRGECSILMAFGGQGSTNSACVDDLRELYSLYKPLVETLMSSLSSILYSLSRHSDTKAFYQGREIDVLRWLRDTSTQPNRAFLGGAAVSFPIIGVTSLLHYCILCKMLGKTPGELGQILSGVAGHSQGIVVAAAVARSQSWESFFIHARWAVELLFWIGYESQMATPQSNLSHEMVNDSVQNGDGIPSFMLSIRELNRETLRDIINANNKHLPQHEQLYLSLINTHQNHVVTGPPKSLRGLVSRLRELCAPKDLDQSRIPYSKRKPVVELQYLPINCPFHSPYLSTAADRVKARLTGCEPATISELLIPILQTETGADMRKAYAAETALADLLIDSITTKVVDWPKSLPHEGANRPSHIITLGTGRFSDLVFQNVDGYGIRVIDGASLRRADSTYIGSRSEIFAQRLSEPSLSPKPWGELFKPHLVAASPGSHVVETRLNAVLKAPPVITAGMTPTTASCGFVSAVMRAGYHIELAGGGYRNAEDLEKAIEAVASDIPPGRGITCNVIYVDPKAIAFSIPLIRRLILRGVPVEGLTIGAGIPSPDIAAEYIQDLGIRHISFKPGSVGGIKEVIEIARKHPTFPIIIQWTGGRAGGHHSCEDFHEPLLKTYSAIRRCENLYLIVGGGFGDGAGMSPYLTGSWSLQFGRPAMPCDGILLGSRMMVATETRTLPGVRKLLVEAPGVEDAEWESSYQPNAAGVLTVISEMGQPIHKLATRAVRFWKEMDDTIFSLPKSERKHALAKRKAEIIRRLNEDFAKPWFGKNAAGQAVDLEEMTYSEVLSRLIDLMYVSHQSRWIDPSYRRLVNDFAIRSLERLCPHTFDPVWLIKPEGLVRKMSETCPDITLQAIHPEDVHFFVQSCKQRGRKPVNFVVTLDDDFEHWFKKDSLWQSEDLDAVVDQDPERVCVLQSPVSVRYSTRDDESSKEILDGIHNDLVTTMQATEAYGVEQEILSPITTSSRVMPQNIMVDDTGASITFQPVPGYDLPSQDQWLECLKPYTCASIVALIREETLFEVSSKRSRSNYLRRIFAPRPGFSLVLSRPPERAFLRDNTTGQILVHVEVNSLNRIWVEFTHEGLASRSKAATLNLEWEYSHQTGLIDCTENRDMRIQEFYAHLWLGQERTARVETLRDRFIGKEFALTRKLQDSLHLAVSHAFLSASPVSPTTILPLETAVIAAWDVIIRPLLVSDLQGDLLRLVHRSIHIEYAPDTPPMETGEAVTSESLIRSVTIEPSGKSVEVEARLMRRNQPLATVTSVFFIRGAFDASQPTFKSIEEPLFELKVDSGIFEAVLRDLEWFRLDESSAPLVGKTLLVQVHTHSQWAGATTNLKVRGTVKEKLWNGSQRNLGCVLFEASECYGNPVVDFLQRKGRVIDSAVPLKSPGWVGNSQVTVTAPPYTHLYTQVSGDCNPIHASPAFAALAELPGPIMHGMYTTAVCRKVIEDCAAPGQPKRLRRLYTSFLGIVQPGDKLTVDISHEAMKNGRMIFQVIARREDSGEEVLRGEAEVEQPSTVYLFTGQGSQSIGMGMELYGSSSVAKTICDDMDRHIMNLYGFSILHIIRKNPKEITIHFRGPQGQKILANYLEMKTELTTADGQRRSVPLIPDLDRESASYTFSEARGLLYATQFAQPAIILIEKAIVEHLRSKGLVQESAMFAGHSLGEHGALASMAPFLDFKDMLCAAFYRGLMMQFAIPRDANGRTGYGMMATNPGRVGKHFGVEALKALVKHIAKESGELLEIVNLNVEGDQYVCAGHIRNLSCLTEILNAIAEQKVSQASIDEYLRAPDAATTAFGGTIRHYVAHSKELPLDVEIPRGKATILLSGIDVPFHSAHMRSWIPGFRRYFQGRIQADDIRPEQLAGRFVPNVMGKSFSLDNSFIREAAHITGSVILEGLV
ncbi:enoyl reductase domain of FAS1 [Nemania sp. FL0031]|nr:enoyl reductase domain of FAS1 [Nemania sp. FL0031]